MKLYWATTEDHDEDWFIIASSQKEAAKLHEDMEGYLRGDAWAEEVLEIPENIPAKKGWPSEELLLAVGAKFIRDDEPRVVEIAGRTFSEGMLESYLNQLRDDSLEAHGKKRLNKTKKPSLH